MEIMSEYQKSQMNPSAYHWVVALLVVLGGLGLLGSIDLETQEVAAAHKAETIAAMRTDAKEKNDIEVQKIALYEEGQRMTGFGAMKLAAK
jgi:hypothetical protein